MTWTTETLETWATLDIESYVAQWLDPMLLFYPIEADTFVAQAVVGDTFVAQAVTGDTDIC